MTSISTHFHDGGWPMWIILVTSVITIAIVVERAVYLFRASVDKDKLLALLKSQVMSGNVQGAIKVCSGNPTPMTRIVQAGLMKFNKSDDEVQAAMDEAALRELPKINARTPYLAMTANFAVMAGLFGTIIGMIRSFQSVGFMIQYCAARCPLMSISRASGGSVASYVRQTNASTDIW